MNVMLYPVHYLKMHGWEETSPLQWKHRLETGKRTYTTKEAVAIERLNGRISILAKKGWYAINKAKARLTEEPAYHVSVFRVAKDPDSRFDKRKILSVLAAFKHERELGLESIPVADPVSTLMWAVKDGHHLKVWCVYCDTWHTHGCPGVEKGDEERIPKIGEYCGHRSSHCVKGPLRGYELYRFA